ncbi:28S ribosomal protein S26, mitochondrial [Thalassophryne amazonica]|uniref:28S ribosomal protein S26, mitochondrial n=1 Tax=Thalassophryne amazonica TaxID=390379 RepID=UPI001472120A|nr:28S ribosomal protein S26, mitochondrial [Thalassophryne amazonica]
MFQVVGVRSASRLLCSRGAVMVESVRGRKSRNDPVAKSKQGRIKVPPPVDPVEMVVMKERFSEYQMTMVALRHEFRQEIRQKLYEAKKGSIAAELAKQEVMEHRELMEWNQQENLRLLELRLQRIQKENEEAELSKKAAALQRERETEQFIREKEREILQLQEDAKNFITLENLDQRIEEALDNPKNYNFAIDREGRVVKHTVLQ